MTTDLTVSGPDDGGVLLSSSASSNGASRLPRRSLHLDALMEALTSVPPAAIASSLVSGFVAYLLGAHGTTSNAVILVGAASAATCVLAGWHVAGRSRVAWFALAVGGGLWCAGRDARPVWGALQAGATHGSSLRDLAALGSVLALSAGLLPTSTSQRVG